MAVPRVLWKGLHRKGLASAQVRLLGIDSRHLGPCSNALIGGSHRHGAQHRWCCCDVEPRARPTVLSGGAHFGGAAFGAGRQKTPTHTIEKDRT